MAVSKVNEKRQIHSGRYELENGSFINMADRELLGTTPFHETRTVMKSPQLVLNSDIPLSERRDDITENNNATITKQGGEYRLRATADTNSEAKLRTRQRGNYLSGSVMDPGLGVRIPSQPTGDAYVRWGYKNDNDGFYFEYDATGVYVVVLNNGTEVERVEQANWNRDNLSGTNSTQNPSKGTLDLSDGNIFQFPFVYYGYGGVQFEVGTETRFGDYELIAVHEIKMKGDVSTDTPNLPITVEVNSGTSGAQLDVFVGGRQISPLGSNDNTARSVGAYRLQQTIGTGTSFYPLISFQHKTGFENILVRLAGFTVITSTPLVVELQRNAGLTGASFTYTGNHTEAEKATEWDISATAMTVGETIYEKLIPGGTGQAVATPAELPARPISELDTITLGTRRITGTANYTVDGLLRVNEDW